jgi:hypothetical protein
MTDPSDGGPKVRRFFWKIIRNDDDNSKSAVFSMPPAKGIV